MENKFTDEEIIIKALNICTNGKSGIEDCPNCPYDNIVKEHSCCYHLMIDVLSLISYYKTANERLQEAYEVKQLEKERYHQLWQMALDDKNFLSEERDKAYKKFAERWHKKINDARKIMLKNDIAESALDIARDITDIVVKEMEGEQTV